MFALGYFVAINLNVFFANIGIVIGDATPDVFLPEKAR